MEDIRYNPTNDVIFHSLFNEKNKRITENFLSEIIGERIEIDENLNRYTDISNPEQKLGILDLHVLLKNNYRCIVEVQLQRIPNEMERFLFYWADAYTRQLEKGKLYKGLNKIISIIILDHTLDELKDIKQPDTRWTIKDNITGKKVLTEHFEMIIIELDKVRNNYLENPLNKKYQWLLFMKNPNIMEMDSILKNNKEIDEAMGELKKLYNDREIRTMADYTEKLLRDEASKEEYKKDLEKDIKLKEKCLKRFENKLEKYQVELEKSQSELEKSQSELKESKNELEEIKIKLDKAKDKEILIVKNMINKGIDPDTISQITGLDKEIIIKFK